MTAPRHRDRIGPGDREGLSRSWLFDARGFVDSWYFGETVRPWNWVELEEMDARAVWDVLDGFVAFFNARYVERSEQRIPPCWAEHGCLVEEITTLSFARWHAFSSEHASIGGAQYWHQYSVPGFLERLGRWLGPDRLERCQQGLHEDASDTEPATELDWKRRRHVIIGLDCEERRRFAAEMTPEDRRLRNDHTPRVAFLDKERSRQNNGDGSNGSNGG